MIGYVDELYAAGEQRSGEVIELQTDRKGPALYKHQLKLVYFQKKYWSNTSLACTTHQNVTISLCK